MREEVKIKARQSGWEVEVIGHREAIQESIQSVLSAVAARGPNDFRENVLNNAGKFNSLRELLVSLKLEGWFETTRMASEVVRETRNRGYDYGQSPVSHALHDLAEEQVLLREGTTGRYHYRSTLAASSRGKTPKL